MILGCVFTKDPLVFTKNHYWCLPCLPQGWAMWKILTNVIFCKWYCCHCHLYLHQELILFHFMMCQHSEPLNSFSHPLMTWLSKVFCLWDIYQILEVILKMFSKCLGPGGDNNLLCKSCLTAQDQYRVKKL